MIIGVTVVVRVLREEEGRYLSEWRQNDASSVDSWALETEGKATIHQMQVFKSRGHQGTGSHPEPQKECPSANASFEPGSLVFRLLSYRKWSEEGLCLEQPCLYWFPAAAVGDSPPYSLAPLISWSAEISCALSASMLSSPSACSSCAAAWPMWSTMPLHISGNLSKTMSKALSFTGSISKQHSCYYLEQLFNFLELYVCVCMYVYTSSSNWLLQRWCHINFLFYL